MQNLTNTVNNNCKSVNGKFRIDNIKLHTRFYDRHLDNAYAFYKKFTTSGVKTDYKNAMDQLNRAYEDMKNMLHERMLMDRDTNEHHANWDCELWNDLYWAIPSYPHQYRIHHSSKLSKLDYIIYAVEFEKIVNLRNEWKVA